MHTEQLLGTTVELFYYDSIFYADNKFRINSQNNFDDAVRSGAINQPLIIALTIVGCILSFSIGLLMKYYLVEQKSFLNKINKANRMIFVIEKDASCLSQTVTIQNEK